MPKPDRWTRSIATAADLERAEKQIEAAAKIQDEPDSYNWFARNPGAAQCDAITMYDVIQRLRHERQGLIDALLHICAGDWDLSTDEIAIAALAAVGVPWPPSSTAPESSRVQSQEGDTP